MKEDTIQHLASEMDELQEQHRDVLAKVRFSVNSRVFSSFSFCFVKMLFASNSLQTNLISSIQIIHTCNSTSIKRPSSGKWIVAAKRGLIA